MMCSRKNGQFGHVCKDQDAVEVKSVQVVKAGLLKTKHVWTEAKLDEMVGNYLQLLANKEIEEKEAELVEEELQVEPLLYQS